MTNEQGNEYSYGEDWLGNSEKCIPPSGGGGISSTIEIGDKTMTFGHGERHLQGTNLNYNAVNQALAREVTKVQLKEGQFYKGRIVVNGNTIEYTCYGLRNGRIHIGTYYLYNKQ